MCSSCRRPIFACGFFSATVLLHFRCGSFRWICMGRLEQIRLFFVLQRRIYASRTYFYGNRSSYFVQYTFCKQPNNGRRINSSKKHLTFTAYYAIIYGNKYVKAVTKNGHRERHFRELMFGEIQCVVYPWPLTFEPEAWDFHLGLPVFATLVHRSC